MLHLINELFTNGYSTIVIGFFSLIAIICATAVITAKNPIVSVLFLIGLFFTMACYLITIGVGFIGLSYILVYVGAVSILFLFILMLINVRISELLSETRNSVPLVFIIGLSFTIIPENILFQNLNIESYSYFNWLKDTIYDSKIYSIVTNNWDNNIINIDNINSLGNIMYANYSMWLIIVAIVLLLSMVGAIVITIK